MAVKICSLDGTEIMNLDKIERSGNRLLIRGKVMGALPMAVVVSPEVVREALKLFNFKLFLFAITLLFRRSTATDKK